MELLNNKYKKEIFIKTNQKIILFIISGLFFSTSLKLYFDTNKVQLIPSQEKKIFYYIQNLRIQISSIQKIYAANEDKWDGVRDIITFVKNITNSIDAFLLNLKKSGLFNYTGDFSFNDGMFKYRLFINDPKTISLTAGGNKEFSHRLIIWKASTDEKYLEIYFDNPDNASGDGSVITFEPGIMNTDLYTPGKRMECYMDIVSSQMTCSWDGPIESNGVVEIGQVIVKKNSDKLTINLLAKTTSPASGVIGGNLVGCDESGSRYYYTLLAVIKDVAPYYTTAAYGLREDQKSNNLGSCSNPYNYGYFNTNANSNASDSTKYFAGMGTTPPPGEYPLTTEVDALLTQEPLKSTVNSIITVDFKSTDTAP